MKKQVKIKHVLWTLFAILFGVLLSMVATNSVGYEQIKSTQNTENTPKDISGQTQNIVENFYYIKDPTKKPNVMAESYFIGDLDTGEVILEKNKNTVFPIASVSKLMTAVVSKEIQDKTEIAKISKNAVATSGKNGDLHINEKIEIGNLIYPMILESSNDAAVAIAENSGLKTFIDKMNEKAKSLNLTNTSFQDPNGLSEKNVSTAGELFKFSQYLKKSTPEILQLSILKSYKIKNHIWFNTSQFLNIPGYQGGKRGYIDESKQTTLSLFTLPLGSTGMRNIGIIILRSPDRLKDMRNIISYLNKNVYYGGTKDADMAWVKTKEGVLEEIEPNFVTLLFGGDIMLDRGVRNSVLKNFNGDYSKMFEKIDILKNTDIVFANLEGPASDQGNDKHNLYSFRMDPSVVPALKGAGFDVLSVANNHIGDWGRDAFTDTLDRLKENEIAYTGGGINSIEAEKPTIVEKNGMKIGYLGFSDVGPNNMAVSENNAGILLASNPRFDEIIQNAAKEVNCLIVTFHFGDEYKTKHNARQELLAHKAIDAGAKIIIGSHPHVVEDTEIYKNGYIAYSLGNFVFDQYFSKDTMEGLLLQIKLNKDGSMIVQKNTMQLNKVFQPDKIIKGKEEKIKLQAVKK
ncbi:MAG: CapA family protein [bacterium]